MLKIRKAVIPAAGLGTRFLPATKAQPKEMLPIVDKPAIQYIVEEAVASGIEEIAIIISRGKSSIENHFDKSYELEDALQEKTSLMYLKKYGKYPISLTSVISANKNPGDLVMRFYARKNSSGMNHLRCYWETTSSIRTPQP